MIAILLALLAAVETQTFGPWLVSQDTDPMTDAVSARAFTRADGSSFGLKCDQPGKNSVYLRFASAQFLGNGIREFSHRFDDDRPQAGYWHYSDQTANFTQSRQIRQFVERAKTAKTLKVRAVTYRYQYVDAVFDVSNASDAAAKVYAACGDMPVSK